MESAEAPIIIGGGRLAKILHDAFPGSPLMFADRELQVHVSGALKELSSTAPIIYAHGPAGNKATSEDRNKATFAHVTLPGLLRYQYPTRKIVYLSTLALWGLYPELKRAGELVLGREYTGIARLGSILSYDNGVSGIFYRRAMRGATLWVPIGADQLEYVFVSERLLIDSVRHLLHTVGHSVCVGASLTLRRFADTVVELVARRSGERRASVGYDAALVDDEVQSYGRPDYPPILDAPLEEWVANGPSIGGA